MRAIIGIALLIVLLAFLGWVTFTSGPGRSSVNVETDKIEHDIQEFKDTVRDAGQEVRDNVSGHNTDAGPDTRPGERAANLSTAPIGREVFLCPYHPRTKRIAKLSRV